MHKLQLFFLVDEFVLSKAPWAVEFLPQTLPKNSSRTMGVDFVRPASCEISIIRHPTRLRGPSWQGWILLQHCIIPFHPQHWRGDWDWLAVEVKPIDQTGKIPPGRSSQCRSFTSEVQQTHAFVWCTPRNLKKWICMSNRSYTILYRSPTPLSMIPLWP